MKIQIYLMVILVSFTLIFSACSNNENEKNAVPLSPQSEKFDGKTPFNYLQSFPEIKDAKIEYRSGDNAVNIYFSIPFRAPYIFAAVNLPDQSIKLFLLEYSNGVAKLSLPESIGDRQFSIRLYDFGSESNSAINTFPRTFYNFENKGWYISHSSIFVNTTLPIDLKHLFAEIQAKEGSVLLYLGEPEIVSAKKFELEIPKYSNLTIDNINLFGYFGFID